MSSRRGARPTFEVARRVAIVGLLLSVLTVDAFTRSAGVEALDPGTWVGGGVGNDWFTVGNWSFDSVPDSASEAALFTDDPVGQTKLTANLSASVTIGQLQYSAAAPSYTITGSTSILNLSPSASFEGVGLVADGAGNQTITTNQVFLRSTQEWNIDGTATVTATGTIEDDSVIDFGLTKNGTGALVFPGDVRYDGPTVVNAGSMVLSFSNTSMLSSLTVNGGVLRGTTSANALGSSGTRNSIALAGGALELANNTGQQFGSTSRITTVTGDAAIRSDRLATGPGVTHSMGPLRIGAQTLTVAPGGFASSGTAGIAMGATTLSGNPTFHVVGSGSAGGQLTLGAVGQTGGARSLSKTGAGTLVLNGAAGYTGSTTLVDGAITLGVANALGSGGLDFAGGALEANNMTDASIGPMALTADSALNLSPGGEAATLTFAGVSGSATGLLTISGWTGSPGGSGTNDRIIFSGGNAPSADFLQHIRFDLGGGTFAQGALGPGGELHPAAPAPQSTVPDVVDLTEAAATTAINDAGLVVGTVDTAPSPTVAVGSVISQDPAAGVSVEAGSAVNLVVSTGVEVPDVVGQPQADATAALTAAGFVVTTSTEPSSSVPSGSVISQNPTGGASASGGSTVALVVSNGDAPPVIALLGDNPLTMSVGGSYDEPGATAADDVDGDLTDAIVIDDSAVAVLVPGSYSVTYDVSDSAGNTASATRTVVVRSTPTYAPADFDGDGDSDVAVFRPSDGRWYVLGQSSVGFGLLGDVPVPGDYDGDGDTDVAVFRPSNGRWYVLGQPSIGYGLSGDIPIPANFDGLPGWERAVFRPSTGGWYVLGQPTVHYGLSGDKPAPANAGVMIGMP